MSTPYPDLTPARQAIERLMADTCTVERDADGASVLNEATGQHVAGPETVVYTGPCLVTPRTTPEQWIGPTETTLPERGDYRGLLPVSAAQVKPGDELTVNVSPRDPQMVGQAFRVVELGEVSTFTVVRIVGLQRL